MLWASLKVVKVPVFTKNWSTPTRPQMFPAGTSSMASTRPPIIKIVLYNKMFNSIIFYWDYRLFEVVWLSSGLLRELIIILIHWVNFILWKILSPDTTVNSLYLDVLLIKIFLLSRDEVWSHNSALLSSGDLSREDTTEGVEPSLVWGGDHLGDVHHQGSVGVAVLDGDTGLIVRGSLVQWLSSRINHILHFEVRSKRKSVWTVLS